MHKFLKVWECGGLVEQVPCSRAGLIFMTKTPYAAKPELPPDLNTYTINSIRTARIVLDDRLLVRPSTLYFRAEKA